MPGIQVNPNGAILLSPDGAVTLANAGVPCCCTGQPQDEPDPPDPPGTGGPRFLCLNRKVLQRCSVGPEPILECCGVRGFPLRVRVRIQADLLFRQRFDNAAFTEAPDNVVRRTTLLWIDEWRADATKIAPRLFNVRWTRERFEVRYRDRAWAATAPDPRYGEKRYEIFPRAGRIDPLSSSIYGGFELSGLDLTNPFGYTPNIDTEDDVGGNVGLFTLPGSLDTAKQLVESAVAFNRPTPCVLGSGTVCECENDQTVVNGPETTRAVGNSFNNEPNCTAWERGGNGTIRTTSSTTPAFVELNASWNGRVDLTFGTCQGGLCPQGDDRPANWVPVVANELNADDSIYGQVIVNGQNPGFGPHPCPPEEGLSLDRYGLWRPVGMCAPTTAEDFL